jgi:NADPH2:quinone reductase
VLLAGECSTFVRTPLHRQVGFADAGRIPSVPANVLLVKNSSVVGLYWGRYFSQEPGTAAASMRELVAMVASGALDVGRTRGAPGSKGGRQGGAEFGLDDAARALSALASGATAGKVIVNCQARQATSRL